MTKEHKVQIKLRLAQLISGCNSVMSATSLRAGEYKEAKEARKKLKKVWTCVNEIYSVEDYRCECGNTVSRDNDVCIECYNKMIEASKPDE